VPVAGSKTGGWRSASSKDSAISSRASRSISRSTGASCVDVHLVERRLAHGVVNTEHLEQVEFDVAQIALVVTHASHVLLLVT
jgi:hypothetical protein